MPSLIVEDHQEEDELEEEDELRAQINARKERGAARQLENAAAVIARGSEHLVCEVNRSRTVLVWTDIVQYPKLTSKDARKDATEGLPRFRYFRERMTNAGFITILKSRYGWLESLTDRKVARRLRRQYPKGAFFFAKNDEAHSGLLNAIAAAEADLDNRAPSQQPPAQRKQVKAKAKKTNERQEESEEELKTSEAEDTEESENNEESEDAEGSDTIEESEDDGEEEEEEEDQEQDEEDENDRRIVSGSGKGFKRPRETDSSEEDADDEEPPSPPVKPKSKQNKSAQPLKVNVDARRLEQNRDSDHTAAMQAIVAAARQYAAGVQARAKVRKDRRRKMEAHYKQAREFADLASKARSEADAYENRAKEARAKGDHQSQRDGEEEEDEEEAETYQEALKKFV